FITHPPRATFNDLRHTQFLADLANIGFLVSPWLLSWGRLPRAHRDCNPAASSRGNDRPDTG
ncbi:hypothetical protein ACC702_38705, partial [Rhizobium ruizarguesonis]